VGDFPVIANTGVNFETIGSILEIADACIIATSLKVQGKPGERIDKNRVIKMMEAVNQGVMTWAK